jgi:DNA-binding NarL/FixJ family response regulator
VSAGLSLVVSGTEIPDLLPSLRDILTETQFRIAGCVRDGLENREIAKELKMSYHTVKAYVYRSCERVGCDNRVQLAVRYQREEMAGRYEQR